MIKPQNTNGFTLVELLIVIVVVAILAAMSVVAYNGVQERALASQRAADISSIEKSYDMYRVVNGYFPKSYTTATSSQVIDQSLVAKMIEMTGTAQSPCPTTPKTKICVYAYGNDVYSEYALVYWDYMKNHWVNLAVGIGEADSNDRWRVETTYGSAEHPLKP